jgi:lipopolysaccharide transport system ATP-binding protein
MSSDAVIQAEALGKRYQLSHRRSSNGDGLRHVLNDAVWAPVRWMRRDKTAPKGAHLSTTVEDFWALRDVNFKVREGDVLGVIGRNGAGKSTLLKLLSQITEPTQGRIRLRGRVASLLEVGTGFHPELTGRENIFLNGAILGMSRGEIRRKFDEIVAFSEVEEFLDTPVKRYSSGMYVRLAFAVAAHLEPEILVVDEVLAVGDAQFQKKSLGKMGEVSRQGRTVLFVSHNMLAVAKLCARGLVLERGKVVFDGDAKGAIAHYQSGSEQFLAEQDLERTKGSIGANQVRFVNWRLLENSLGVEHTCYSREEIVFRFDLITTRRLERVHFGFHVRGLDEALLLAGHNLENGGVPPTLEPGSYAVEWRVRVSLKPGVYWVEVAANEEMAPGQGDTWRPAQKLEVMESRFSSLPEMWRGVVNEPVAFSYRPA